MDGIWNPYNLKSTGRIYTFGVLKCSEKFKVLGSGGESCARAGEGVTFPKSLPPRHVHMTHHRREHRPSVSRSPTCGSRVNAERLRCLN